MATAVSMGLFPGPPVPPVDASPSSGFRSRSRDNAQRRTLRRSWGSVESLRNKRARQSPPDRERVQAESGQQFRVGNVTSNGRLQLRPVALENHPFASPPLTPPYSKAAYGAIHDELPDLPDDWRGSVISVSTDAAPLPGSGADPRPNDQPATGVTSNRTRSHSFSTMDDPIESDRRTVPNIKVLINNASPPQPNSRAATDASQGMLEVSIPHYRLGTPHFSGKGSAILHSSIHTESSVADGVESSTFSGREYARIFPRPPNGNRRVSAGGSQGRNFISVDGSTSLHRTTSSGVASSHNSQKRTPEPTILLELESSPLNPVSRALVRVSRTSGQVLAATPSGLIAQITSPSLLDYDLLSDFFLTFRSYLTTHQLVGFLISRLQWAVSRTDDFGRIVRVRTFVALRHWILNYFVDDFVSNDRLRQEFCNLVNDLCDEVKARRDGGVGDLNILGELKKCWRRTCGLYWDVPEHKDEAPSDPIMPGGRLGSRTSGGDEPSAQAFNRDQIETGGALISPTSPVAAADGPVVSMFHSKTKAMQRQQNRESDQSTHVVSCSITFKSNANKSQPSTGVRPAPSGVVTASSSARMSPNLRKNPPLLHGRTGSFSDALRDSRSNTLHNLLPPQTPVFMSSHHCSGSLIRGALLEPTSPFVDSLAPTSPTDDKARFDFNFNGQSENYNQEEKSQAPSNPGMKKFLGTVKRAFSARQNTPPHTSGSDRKITVVRNSPRASGIPGSMASSIHLHGAPKRKLVSGQTQPRVDLMTAAASESFFRLAKELNDTTGPTEAGAQSSLPVQNEPSEQNPMTSNRQLSASAPVENRRLNSNITAGSRSIVIVDDTAGYSSMPLRPVTQDSKQVRSYGGTVDTHNSRIGRQTVAIGVEPESPMANRLLEMEIAGIVTPPASSVDPHSPQFRSAPFETTAARNMLQQSEDPVQESRRGQTGATQSMPLDRHPQLRRRPGGDLRAVDHVRSLGENTSHRSAGSHASTSELSVAEPTYSGAPTNEQPARLAVTLPMEKAKSVSVLDTHSSQPMLRPSFEQQVAKIAQLPDDQDDGGIETTLQKLEGHIRGSNQGPFDDELDEVENEPLSDKVYNPQGTTEVTHELPAEAFHREDQHDGQNTAFYDSSTDAPDANDDSDQVDTPRAVLTPQPDGRDSRKSNVNSLADSAESYSSTPLLERGMSFPAPKKRHSSSDWLKVSLPNSAAIQKTRTSGQPPTPSGPFLAVAVGSDRVDGTSSVNTIDQISRDANFEEPTEAHHSFLLDDNQSLNTDDGDAKETSLRPPLAENQTSSFLYDDEEDDDEKMRRSEDKGVLPHPLRHPDTPPTEKPSPFVGRQSTMASGPSLAGHIYRVDRDTFNAPSTNSRTAQSRTPTGLQELSLSPTMSNVQNAAHIPFVLAYDSLLLAQQFTLVEKDALTEISWRQLIDLKWQTNAKTCRTWADCLKPGAADGRGRRFMGGVDICITRFNIVVKWATSEIVLCQDMADRAACITKYIHIARHCRQIRNWSTMFQITMALVSADVARLKHTWAEVPERERTTLKALETLIMPTRNFHNLRDEMEIAIAGPPAPGTDGGCIPFIGIYTHDLIYNAQKPALAPPPEGVDTAEPMVNFERHRTAATIVKSLLRLIDASSKYPFRPLPEVLSRCLWMATLSDEEISRRSKSLETVL